MSDNHWQPLTRRQIPEEYLDRMAKAASALGVADLAPDELWTNDEYEVLVRYLKPARGRAGALHLSLKRYDKEATRDWRELQSIKNEVCGWGREGIELFPAESRLVDQANQTHLWVLSVDETLPLGFPNREIKTDAESRAEMAKLGGDDSGAQRDWRPGLSTGPHYKPDEWR